MVKNLNMCNNLFLGSFCVASCSVTTACVNHLCYALLPYALLLDGMKEVLQEWKVNN